METTRTGPERGLASTTAARSSLLSRLSRMGWPRLGVSVAVVVIHLLAGNSDYDGFECFLAGLAGALTLNVLWSYFASERRGIPVLPWVFLQLYVFFALPVFSRGGSTLSVTFSALSKSGAIRDALLATILFLCFVVVGFVAVPRAKRQAVERGATRPIPILLVLIYGGIALIVGASLSFYEVDLKGAWYTQVLFLFFLPGTAQLLLLFEYQRRPRSRSLRLLLLAFTTAAALTGLLSSRLSFALVPVVTLGLGALAMGARLPKRLVVLVLVVLVVINPAKHVYRQITGYRTDEFATHSLGEMVEAWIQSIDQVWSDDEGDERGALETTTERLNYLTVNASTLAWVPNRVPYASGAPWLAVPYSLVPRFLWHNKPILTEITNDRFAILFGMTTRRNTSSTTLAYPAIADGYWNFGWIGVALAGLLAGLFWALVRRSWSRTNRFRYVFAFSLLIGTRATAALPNLLLGVLQVAVATLVVTKGLELVSGFMAPRRRV